MKKLAKKSNLSSTQVLKTLKVLLQGEYTMGELLAVLNSNEEVPIFNNSVVSKYINTCRSCGINIPKVNNHYVVTNMAFGLDLSLDDLDLIKVIQQIVSEEMTSRSCELFQKMLDKLNQFSSRKIVRINKDDCKTSLESFERAVAQNRKVNLIFKTKETLECIPITIVKAEQKTFFKVYNKRMRMIDIARLSGMETLDVKYIDIPSSEEQTVIYKLKGALAKRYEARANEICEINNEGTITVTNKGEPKEVLFSRLMRYDDKCEILNPKSYREEFLQMICETLSNYGV